MKPPPPSWLGITAAAAAAVLCWYMLTMEPDATPRPAGKACPPALVTGKGGASSPAEPLPKFGTPEFESALHERGLKSRDSRGRDAAGLIAMWDLSRDSTLLVEAEKNFPNDPRVGMTMFYCAGGPARWRVESLIAAEPASPEGLYLKARAFLTGSWEHKAAPDHPGAIEALRQAAALNSRPDDHTLEPHQDCSRNGARLWC